MDLRGTRNRPQFAAWPDCCVENPHALDAVSQGEVEDELMNWKEIEGRWNQFTRQVNPNLGKPSDDHIAVILANPMDDSDAQRAPKAGPEEAPQADAEPSPVPRPPRAPASGR
jgi:hypothetical protein